MPLAFFDNVPIREAEAGIQHEVQSLYLEDHVPWVVGYSGGKDSTATLQLVWRAIAALDHRASAQADSRYQYGYAGGKSHCGQLG